MDLQISPFTIESYDEVHALWSRTDGVGLSEADSRENIARYLERNPGMSVLARDTDGTVVGAVLAGHDGRRGYLHHLAVDPRCRRAGVGRVLVDRCIETLRRAGIVKCHLFIFTDNTDGIAFWRSVGWTWREDIGIMSRTISAST